MGQRIKFCHQNDKRIEFRHQRYYFLIPIITFHYTRARLMSQTQQWLLSLKHHLKGQGLTYKDVARAIDVSEASVKRLFSTQSISLARLEQISHFAGLSLTQLAELAQTATWQQSTLTWQQEERIVQDLTVLMTAVSVLSGFTYSDLIAQYELTPAQALRALAKLDGIGLIELLPKNRLRLRVSPTFHWLPGGPIQQYFLSSVAQDFLSSNFKQEDEKLLVHNGLCSQSTNKKIQQRMAQFIREVNALILEDAPLPMKDKFGNTLVVALRRWQFSGFKQKNRNKNAT